ncbi:MAG: hypothetical protein V1844_14515 [Pseudomonadota bacterium]
MRCSFIPLMMLITVILVSGCAAPAKKTMITPLNMEFGADSLLSGKTGTPVSYAEMLMDLAPAGSTVDLNYGDYIWITGTEELKK